MTDAVFKSVNDKHWLELDDHAEPDLKLLILVGTEIRSKLPNIWSNIGAVWMDAQDVLTGEVPDEDDRESDSRYEDDPSYKPVYRIRDILNWGAVWVENDQVAPPSAKDPILTKIYKRLSNIEPLKGSPEPSERDSILITTEDAPIIYSPSLQDLPSELLAETVQLALQEDQHIILTMSRVNRTFRAFILSTPILWTKIDIMFPEKRIKAHLERSGSSLLRVQASLVLLTTARSQGLTKLESFKRMIQPHASRIAALEMRYTNAFWSVTALVQFAGLGALLNLDAFEYGCLLHRPILANNEFQFNCKPKRICIEGIGIKTFRPIYSDRVLSLEVTECWERGLTNWREALQLMPSLQVLKISDFQNGDNDLDDTIAARTKVSLPHLHTLSLTRLPRAILVGFIGALHTPNLVSVAVAPEAADDLQPEGYDAPAPWMKTRATELSEVVLLPFVSANPQLQELDIHNCWLTADMWRAVFAPLYDLKKLRIASSDVSSGALRSLVASSRVLPALPSLTHLTLDNEALDENSDLTFGLIHDVITTRWNLFNQQQDKGGSGRTQIQALKSVVLRGWNESRIPALYDTRELTRIRGLVERLHVETFRAASEDGEATDWEWESQSDGSWASGDQAVVDLGDSLHRFEWGMDSSESSDNEGDLDDAENWDLDDNELLSSGSDFFYD
ncbi:hypothetical protein FS837_009119 [Tulasnella sp. UAMH 9824]|nr:hypothetical protein FS837_009119 [Tulasnella sp. UAMH 9824]